MASSFARPFNPYHWQYIASRHYLNLFIALHFGAAVLASYVLHAAFGRPWALLAVVLLGIAAHLAWGFKRYLASCAMPLELSLTSAGELQLLVSTEDGVRHAQPVELTACRWLGVSLLVVTLRPKSQSRLAKLLGCKRQALVLWADNSSAEDRHRLAMFYHSGPAE